MKKISPLLLICLLSLTLLPSCVVKQCPPQPTKVYTNEPPKVFVKERYQEKIIYSETRHYYLNADGRKIYID
jgi:ribosomal protein S30